MAEEQIRHRRNTGFAFLGIRQLAANLNCIGHKGDVSAVIWSLMPIVLSTAKVMGFNPIGAAVIVWLAATAAFSTPMSCPLIPLTMAAGGYNFKSILKQSLLPSLIMGVVGIIWTGILYPIF